MPNNREASEYIDIAYGKLSSLKGGDSEAAKRFMSRFGSLSLIALLDWAGAPTQGRQLRYIPSGSRLELMPQAHDGHRADNFATIRLSVPAEKVEDGIRAGIVTFPAGILFGAPRVLREDIQDALHAAGQEHGIEVSNDAYVHIGDVAFDGVKKLKRGVEMGRLTQTLATVGNAMFAEAATALHIANRPQLTAGYIPIPPMA